MARLLLIETTTINCSVGLSDGDGKLYLKEEAAGQYVHAEALHQFIKHVLNEAQLEIQDLDAIAVSKGPGSYTGLRIGISAAKGLCFAANKPLIAIDTLEALALDASSNASKEDLIIPMIDARRMEVYCSVYQGDMTPIQPPQAVIIEQDYFKPYEGKKIWLTGDGSSKLKEHIFGELNFLNRMPSASMMQTLAEQYFHQNKFEDAAYFDPFYLKEYQPGISTKSVL
jgi:tRNA threonylcarbamoyladenosine biosynthesis protein TsaB